MLKERNRYQALKRILDYSPDIYGIIFCRTRKETQTTAESLMQDGYKAEALHGDLSQAQRDYVMRKFRQKSIHILVATDVAARGLDVDDLTHVIHHRLPDEPAIYTHRSGRTARAGKSGISIALLNTKEMRRVREIEKKIKISFEQEQIPDGRAICEKQLFSLVDRVVNADVNKNEIQPYLSTIFEAFKGISKQDLIQRFISVEFNRFLEYYRDAEDINMSPDSERRHVSSRSEGRNKRTSSSRKTRGDEFGTRFRLGAGRDERVNKGAVLRLICDRAKIKSSMIGVIEVKQHETFFAVQSEVAGNIHKIKKNLKLDGTRVEMQEVSNARTKTKRK